NLTILYILHMNKQTDQNAKHRALGTVAFRNVSKSTLLVVPNPDLPDGRVMAQEKSNLTRKKYIVGFTLCTVARSEYPRVDWDKQWMETDIEELMNCKPSKQRQAERLLRQWLKEGPRRRKHVLALAQRRDISEATLKLAKQNLAIVSEK